MSKHTKIRDISYVAMAAALIAVSSWITIPGPVPFTLQTFALFASLCILGGRRGTVAVLLYILLGAVGLPVFSGFRGGIGVLFASTGGYIVGFLLSALLYWLLENFIQGRVWMQALIMLLGMLCYFIFGTIWFRIVYLKTGEISFFKVLSLCVFPFIIPDSIKIALALLVGRRIKRFVL